MTRTNKTQQIASYTPEPWHIDGKGNVRSKQPSDYEYHRLVATIADKDGLTSRGNARRICAAVNACKAISTEALERGIIAELRHLLGELVSAAGDLDAAINGVTDQFDAGRARLNATIRAAQSAIDAGTEIDLHELLAGHRKIAVVWCIEDVQDVRPDLTDEQAWKVLQLVKRTHDCNYGITWLTLEIAAEQLFGYPPQTAMQEKQP